MMVGKSSASWKQKRALPPPGAASLKKRRTWSTLALSACLLFIIWVVYYLATLRTAETHLLVVGKSTDEALALAPIRYVQTTWEDLESLAEKATAFKVDLFSRSQAYRFGGDHDEKSFYSKIEEAVSNLKGKDSLVVWINGTGITVNDRPVIVGDLFDAANYATAQGQNNLVDIAQTMQAMSKWPGPKLLLIDWGQELFDPRIELSGNRFASKLSDVVRSHPSGKSSPLCVVTSHFDGQISLVDCTATKKQSLFSRAVKEGFLLEHRRAPDDPKADFIVPPKATVLSLRNFVEYVARRVSADSYGYQEPAVYLSGTGLLDKVDGDLLKNEALATLTSGRLNGFPKPAAKTNEDKDDSGKSKKSNEGQAGSEAEVPELALQPQPVQELHDIWLTIERLRTPDPKNHNWSYAALSPLAYKQIVASAMDAELRYYAQADSKDLGADLELQKLSPLDYPIGPRLEGSIQASDRVEFESTYKTTQLARQWASIEYDLNYLSALLNSLGLSEIDTEINQLKELLNRSVWEDWSAGRQRLDKTIGSLTKKIKLESNNKNLGKSAAITEILLRSNLLTADQRLVLRKLQETKLKLVDDESDLDKNRSLTRPESQARPPSWSLVRSPLSEALLEQARNQKLLVIDENLASIASVDPRDVRDALSSFSSSAVDRITRKLEYPQFKMPAQQQLWEIVWDDSSIKANEFKLEGTKELTLLLKSANPNSKFPELRLDVGDNLMVFVNDAPWDVLQPLPQSLFASSKSGKEKRLLVKVAAKESELSTGQPSLGISTTTPEVVSKLPEPLLIYIPLDQPIELVFHQQYSKDGSLDWYEQRATLRPFAGRDSKFQVRIQNLDRESHHVEVRLYALPENLRGQTGWVHSSEDLKQLLGRQPDLVWEADVQRTANPKEALVAKFTAPQSPTDTKATAAPTTPPAAPAGAGKLNILGGVVAMAFVDHKAEPLITKKINFSPRPAEELFDVEVKTNRDKTLKVVARWKDGETKDARAAIAPSAADLAAQPLSIRVDTMPWRQANPNVQALSIELKDDTTTPQEFITDELDGRDKEVWLDIDGTPRALVYDAPSDIDSIAKIPKTNQARVVWRTITNKVDGKPVSQYVPYKPPEAKKDMSALFGGTNAIFKDLSGTVDIELAIDLPRSSLGNASEGDDRFLVRMGKKKQDKIRPRITTADMKCVGDQLVVSWHERDQVVSFDFSRDSITEDFDYPLSIEGPAVKQDLVNVVVVADLDPPLLENATLDRTSVVQGANATINLKLTVKDRTKQVTVQTVTAPGKLVPPLLIAPKKGEPGESRITIPIATATLPVGTYNNLRVTLADAFGHVKEYGTNCSFDVQAPKVVKPAGDGAAAAPAIVGNVKINAVILTADGSTRRSLNPVKFEIIPPPDKEKLKKIGDDEILIVDLKAGSYTVKATASDGSKNYEGEEKIDLMTPEDFKKKREISMKPKQK